MIAISGHVTAPRALIDSASFRRVHTRAMKRLVRNAMKFHHSKIGGHFKQDARHRYRHATRSQKTKDSKRRKGFGIIDLIKTKTTQQTITGGYRSLRVGGTVATKITGSLRYRFPFSVSSSENNKPGVNRGSHKQVGVLQMSLEIEAWDQKDIDDVINGFQRDYDGVVLQEIGSAGRIRKTFKQLAGIS